MITTTTSNRIQTTTTRDFSNRGLALRRLATAAIATAALACSAASAQAADPGRTAGRAYTQEAGWCGQQADGDRAQKEAVCNAFAMAPAGRGDGRAAPARFAPEDWNGPAFDSRADPASHATRPGSLR